MRWLVPSAAASSRREMSLNPRSQRKSVTASMSLSFGPLGARISELDMFHMVHVPSGTYNPLWEAPMHFKTTIEINAPLDRVWDALVDVETWPEWTASIREVKGLDGAVLAFGSRVRIKQPRMPSLVWEVSEFEPTTSFTWRSTSPGVTTVGSHVVTATT